MLRRNISQRLVDALADTPVVLLHGARQTGKTTLVRSLATDGFEAEYATFDSAATLAAAAADPEGFLDRFEGPAIIDEVQRLPEIAVAIKASVDRDRRSGRFLLTGSANVLQIPWLSDSLAGRMEIQPLWPFSQGEIAGIHDDLPAALFGEKLPALTPPRRDLDPPLIDRLCVGGYPEVQKRPSEDRRNAWFSSYVTTILQRDVRDLSDVESLTAFPRLLALLATRAGSLLNYADVARSVQIPQTTLKRYLALLEATFLIKLLPAWSTNLGLRLIKSPKFYLCDTGLLAHLLNTGADRLRSDLNLLGHVVENFVVLELYKQLTWSAIRVQLYHLRTPTGREVDIVLEGPGGRIVGIEVKASAKIDHDDFRGLRHLADVAGERFARGVLLYTGSEVLPFGSRMLALPIAALWRTPADSDAKPAERQL